MKLDRRRRLDGLSVVILEEHWRRGFLFTQFFAFIKTPSHFLYFSLQGNGVRGAIDDVAACTHGARSLGGTVNPCFVIQISFRNCSF